MLLALLTLAAETAGEEHSQVPFYVAGSLLALWAVVVSALGISRSRDFPDSEGAKRGVIAITAVLVAAAMATAVITG